jgi:desampylase
MEITLTSGVLATLRKEAEIAHPLECCGLLLGADGLVVCAIPCPNLHPDPARHFEIDPAALIAAHRTERAGGPQVLGYYHSHPNGLAEPSASDRASASADGRIWAIIANSMVTLWIDRPDGFEPLPLRLADG